MGYLLKQFRVNCLKSQILSTHLHCVSFVANTISSPATWTADLRRSLASGRGGSNFYRFSTTNRTPQLIFTSPESWFSSWQNTYIYLRITLELKKPQSIINEWKGIILLHLFVRTNACDENKSTCLKSSSLSLTTPLNSRMAKKVRAYSNY